MEEVVTEKKLHSYYEGKKVLVTGHTGFKGAWLCAWLNKLGAIVKGYALQPEYEDCLYNILQPLYNKDSIIADIRNKALLQQEVIYFQPDYIFHLAAQPLVRRSYQIPAETFEVNAVGTANLLEAVKLLPKKCSIIIITTDKVYDNKEQDILYHENDVLGGYDPYSASKACTEIVVSSFRNSFFNTATFDAHHKAIASARAGNVIGGGDYSADRIIPDIIKALQHNKVIGVRNPNAVRPWQHVLEPLGGYLLLGGLLNEQAVKFSGAYNFGPEAEGHLIVKNLVEQSIAIWGSGEWEDTSDATQPHEAGLLKLDISKAKKMLDWQPKLNAVKSIEWTINWYRQPKKDAAAYTFQQIDDYMNL
ncbi:MAG: CDP-glucose 4,6-dehydratase [Ferruginibacter sp.]